MGPSLNLRNDVFDGGARLKSHADLYPVSENARYQGRLGGDPVLPLHDARENHRPAKLFRIRRNPGQTFHPGKEISRHHADYLPRAYLVGEKIGVREQVTLGAFAPYAEFRQ